MKMTPYLCSFRTILKLLLASGRLKDTPESIFFPLIVFFKISVNRKDLSTFFSSSLIYLISYMVPKIISLIDIVSRSESP